MNLESHLGSLLTIESSLDSWHPGRVGERVERFTEGESIIGVVVKELFSSDRGDRGWENKWGREREEGREGR